MMKIINEATKGLRDRRHVCDSDETFYSVSSARVKIVWQGKYGMAMTVL